MGVPMAPNFSQKVLGKIATKGGELSNYMANKGAQTAAWVAKNPNASTGITIAGGLYAGHKILE